ncbi:MAG: hypothetical protein NVSMB27_48680 [Ktedonobacteraceae bacterium]
MKTLNFFAIGVAVCVLSYFLQMELHARGNPVGSEYDFVYEVEI